ncbi:hypothetical protein GE21DRAFT_1222322, partial [Neurospora crassa]
VFQFNLNIFYIPNPLNIVPDTLLKLLTTEIVNKNNTSNKLALKGFPEFNTIYTVTYKFSKKVLLIANYSTYSI